MSASADAAGADGPHRHMLQGTSFAEFARLREAGAGAVLIAGAYNRPLNVRHGGFLVETEEHISTFDIQTPSLFVDLRIQTDRPAVSGSALADLTLEELTALSRQHCFAGYSSIEHDAPGYEGHPVCDRLVRHCPCLVFPHIRG